MDYNDYEELDDNYEQEILGDGKIIFNGDTIYCTTL